MLSRPGIPAGWLALILLPALTCAAPTEQQSRGQYLVNAGGCVTCHTEDRDGAAPLAGGRELVSPFGTFYSPNITPDKKTGIGNWSDEDFERAMHEGLSPSGSSYFPAFPYTAYTGITRQDALAIKAYLFSLPPVSAVNKEHDLPAYMSRFAAKIWRSRYFEAHRFQPDPEQSDEWNRGAYLVRHLGHCGECHTPRKSLGALIVNRELAGNPEGPDDEHVPNITPHKDAGIGRWSKSDIEYFLDIGMLPDGDFAGGSMVAVIEDNTSKLTREDRLAIASYLQALPPAADKD